MLIVFAGLPGVGKSTLSRALAKELGATWLRIDSIEQAMREGANLPDDIGPAGYFVAYRLAADNLQLGGTVIADSVNPLEITRDAWREIGESVGVRVVEVEVICSDVEAHQRRIETREVQVPGLRRTRWEDVTQRRYDPWTRTPLRIDTAGRSVEESLQVLLGLVKSIEADKA